MRRLLFLAIALLAFNTALTVNNIIEALFSSIIPINSGDSAKVVEKCVKNINVFRNAQLLKKPTDGLLTPTLETAEMYELVRYKRGRISSRSVKQLLVQCLVCEEEEVICIPQAFNYAFKISDEEHLPGRVIQDLQVELSKVQKFHTEKIPDDRLQSPKAHNLFALAEYFGLDLYPSDTEFIQRLTELLPKFTQLFVDLKRKTLNWERDRLVANGGCGTMHSLRLSFEDRIVYYAPFVAEKWSIEDLEEATGNDDEEGVKWQQVIVKKHNEPSKSTVMTKGRFKIIDYSEHGNHFDAFLKTIEYAPFNLLTNCVAPKFKSTSSAHVDHSTRFTLLHLAHHLHTFTHDLLAHNVYGWSRMYRQSEEGNEPIPCQFANDILDRLYWKEMVISRQVHYGSRPAIKGIVGRTAISYMVSMVHHSIHSQLLRLANLMMFSFPDKKQSNGTICILTHDL